MSVYNQFNDRDVHAYLMYGQDGLQDIAVGLVLLLAGLLLHTDNAAFGGILAVLVYPFLLMGKRYLTMPRVAPAELPPARLVQQRTILALVIGLAFLLLGVLVFGVVAADLLDLTGRFWIITGSSLAILVAGLAALLAWRAGNRRLPLYFLLIMVTFLLISQSSVPLPVMMMVLGLLITLIGSYILGRFLLTHPRLL
ncbi:MAG: hypothetical protein KDE59_10370 [Anaerolineales bacterium]|nr:hypothetical protein [Anaerolineales bacterium]